MPMKRRDFLRAAGCFVASAGVGACGDDGGSDNPMPMMPDAGGQPQPQDEYSFPQGVASGDPRPSSVMLWTRVELPDEAEDTVMLTAEVATTNDFAAPVVMATVPVTSASDHTLRLLVEDLTPNTVYYYRFVVGEYTSRIGRTRTAPDEDADVAVHFAWASCQDFQSGFYGAYRRMIEDDKAAAAEDQLHFVVHVGDFIYETRNEGFQNALDENLEPIELRYQDGELRMVPPMPDETADLRYARTVADYRHLYRTFLSDPDLQEARARWPFICVWDDHEFTNDSWQTQATYDGTSTTNEPSQTRKVAANQAWFEFMPAILSEAEPAAGVDAQASNFAFAEVEDVEYSEVNEDNLATEANNLAALATMTIYRRLRFGRHVELVLTDGRSYRSDHPVAEGTTGDNPLIFHPRAALPLDVVNTLDAGRTANGGAPPDEVDSIPNTRKDSPPGTMLGAEQKQWWKDVMSASDATWKIWGNAVPITRIRLDSSEVALLPGDLVLSSDAWDGYATERRELMNFLIDNDIANVVSVSGDHHAHFAGLVYDDFDIETPRPAMVDFVTAGISSTAQFAFVVSALPDSPFVNSLRRLVTYEGTVAGEEVKYVENLNTLIRYGSSAANVAADGGDATAIADARNPDINDHLRYADANAQGYGLMTVTATGAQTTLVTIEHPVVDRGTDGAVVVRRAQFDMDALESGGSAQLSEPEITGRKPFPLT